MKTANNTTANGSNKYPSIAAIVSTETTTVTCSATIIAVRYVITAAHCFEYLNITKAAVLVGTDNYFNGRS